MSNEQWKKKTSLEFAPCDARGILTICIMDLFATTLMASRAAA